MENRIGLIYKATDKVLNKSYIGQTLTTLENRKNQHIKNAFNKNDKTYFTMFYKMLRILGEDNFEWTVIEENISKDDLNSKERFYIEKFDSYENGYNEGPGGQLTHASILNENQVDEIIKELKETDISMVKLGEKFKVTREVISDINCGETWYNKNLNYPIRPQGFNKKINFSQEQILDIINLLNDSEISYKTIAEKYNCHPNSIVKINDGIHYRQENISYPIREKAFVHIDEETIKNVVNDLMNTNDIQKDIAERYNIERKTVNNINRGNYHKKDIEKLFSNVTFPIRKK